MTDFEVLEDYVAGDDLDIGPKNVLGVDPADPLVQAWLTVKAKIGDADPGALQKVITGTAVAGVGQITANGDATHGAGTATVLFQLTAAETLALGTTQRYTYDIQVKTQNGKLYTAVTGPLQFRRGITQATG